MPVTYTIAYRRPRSSSFRKIADWSGTKAEALRVIGYLSDDGSDVVELADGKHVPVLVVRSDATEHLGLSVHPTGKLADLKIVDLGAFDFAVRDAASEELDEERRTAEWRKSHTGHDHPDTDEAAFLHDKTDAIKANAMPVTTAGPTGRERTGEHWVTRMNREVTHALAFGRKPFWMDVYNAKHARLALLGVYGVKRDTKAARAADREVALVFDQQAPATTDTEE